MSSTPRRSWHSLSRLWVHACMLLLLSMLAACGCRNDLVFDNVLQSECDPPCWRGITPGMTTRDEVLETLGKGFKGEDPSFPVIRWGTRCVEGGGLSQVKIDLSPADRVVSIKLVETEPRYTFADVVSRHGPPSSVMVNECAPDSDLGFVYLVYPEAGMAFATGYVRVLGEPWQRPSAEERVFQWIYFAPTSPDRALLEDGILPGCGLRFYSYSSEWLGFGE